MTVGQRTFAMTTVAALSLLFGVFGLMGSASMVSNGLDITRIGSATHGPTLGSNVAPLPGETSFGVRVAAFGAVRGVLSLLLVIGAVGTLGVRPYGRRASLAYATGWILVGAVEPWALRFRFGWEVVASAAYPFLLLLLFNGPRWKAAFARPAAAGPEAP